MFFFQMCKAHLNKPVIKRAWNKRDLSIEGINIFYRKSSRNRDPLFTHTLKLYPKLETEFIIKEAASVNKPKISTKFFDSETDKQMDTSTLTTQRY